MNHRTSVLRATNVLSLCAVTSVLGVWSSPARAQTAQGFALNRLEPAETGSEWFANDTLDLRGQVRPAIGLLLDYGYKPYVLVDSNGNEVKSIVSDQLFLHVGGSLVLFDRLRLGVSLPVAIMQAGDANGGVVNGQRIVGGTSGGIGDLRIGADLRLVGRYGDPFTLALGGRVWAPTGDQAQLLGDGSVRIGPHFAAAGDLGAFAYAASVGATYRANSETFAGHPTGSQVDFGLAMGVRAAEKKLLIGPELYGSTNVSTSGAFFDERSTPLGLLGSVHYSAGDVRFGLGAGPGLSHAAGTPQVRALASLEYAPAIAEEKAPPSDRDGDGIFDTDDACPEIAGVRTNDPKTNGCPADRDGDGIADMLDACPDVAGIKTDDPKTNGCPADRDNDGIADMVDACPDVAGIKTDDPKTNGCPSDRDKDGIVDTLDACPDAPGPASSDPKKNGCPMARIEAGQVKIVDQIKFKTASTAILPESQPVIDAVAKILHDHPEITFLRVEGHTDNVGKAQMNKVLSDKRAASVVSALVKAGVSKARLANEGFGLERPLAPNDTEEGRTINRRVEFHIAGAHDSEHSKTLP